MKCNAKGIRRRMTFGTAFMAALSLATLGCAQVYPVSHPKQARHHAHGQGPPPHAPAHGYRHKHQAHGADLVFDSGLGVYVVVGRVGVYFDRERYYRRGDRGWEVSLSLSSGWTAFSSHELPPGLRSRTKHGKRAKHPGRGRHKQGQPPAGHD